MPMSKSKSTLKIITTILKTQFYEIKMLRILSVPILTSITVRVFSEIKLATCIKNITDAASKGSINNDLKSSLMNFFIVYFVNVISYELAGFLLSRPLQTIYVNSLVSAISDHMCLEFEEYRNLGIGQILKNVERRGLSTGEAISSLLHFLPLPLYLIILPIEMLENFSAVILLTILVFIVFYCFVTFKISDYRVKKRKKVNELINEASNTSQEILVNYENVKAFGKEEYEIGRFNRKLNSILRPAAQLYQSLYVLNFVQLITLFFMDMAVILQIYRNKSENSIYATYFKISESLRRHVNSLGSQYATFKTNMENIRSSLVPLSVESDGFERISAFREKIVFKNAGLRQGGAVLLENVDLELRKGDKVAIVGPNGAGKTSFVRILMGFYDYSGSVEIDGIEIKRLQKRHLRSLISFIPQNSMLINESVEENAIYGSDTTLYDVHEAAKKYGLHEDFLRLENGYDSVVGESGKLLSGGERQKIALLRAVLRDADIFILDEPTASIDSKSEMAIFKNLLGSEKTVIVIVHNHELLHMFNKIVLFKDRKAFLFDGVDEFYSKF